MTDVPQTDTQQSPAQTDSQAESPILTITPLAVQKVRELMAERELEGYALRVFVQGGGCSGFQYGMAFEDRFFPQDQRVEVDDIALVIDPTSLSYMMGAQIDFVDSLMGGGFQINNPNAVSSCGCGHSFRTEDGADSSGHAGGCSSCG